MVLSFGGSSMIGVIMIALIRRARRYAKWRVFGPLRPGTTGARFADMTNVATRIESRLPWLLLLLAACSSGSVSTAVEPGPAAEPPAQGDTPDAAGGGGAEVDGGASTGDRDAAPSTAVCGDGVASGDEACDTSAPVACSSLAAVWASGTATCRSDCSGFDVSGCTRSTQSTEAVFPSKRDARFASALCNDGTPFGFGVSLAPKPTKKWVIYLEGGGHCDGKYTPCAGRGPELTSSKNMPGDRAPYEVANGTLLSRDPAINPDFYDANFAKGNYCSSDLWTGRYATPQPIKIKTATEQWVFTGRDNARAMISTLFAAYGVDDATSEILWSGNSAGGFGAMIDVDLIATRAPKAIADQRFALLVGSAWTSGMWTDPAYTYMGKGDPDAVAYASLLATYKGEPNVKCAALAAATGKPLAACAAGPMAYAAAASPPPVGFGIRTFVAQNRLDQLYMKQHMIPVVELATSAADAAARATWLSQMTESMKDLPWLYSPADPQEGAGDPNLHGLVPDPIVWSYEPPGLTGQSLRAVIGQFWASRSGGPGVRVVYDGAVPHSP